MGKEYSWTALQSFLVVLRKQGRHRPGRGELFVSDAPNVLLFGTPLKEDEVPRVRFPNSLELLFALSAR